jgi:hypothetical protein
VKDAKTARRFGVLIVLPLIAVVTAQFSGRLWLSATTLDLIALGSSEPGSC